MTIVIQARSLLEHVRHICERPKMYAADFSLGHLFMFILGHEVATGEQGLPSQYERFREWVYKARPEWRDSSMWWGGHVLTECKGDLDKSLGEIILLIDGFLATEGHEGS